MNLQQKIFQSGIDLTADELMAVALAESLIRERAEQAGQGQELSAKKGLENKGENDLIKRI